MITESPPLGRLILVADDDPDLRILLERRLVKSGHRVIVASDGEEAIRLFDQWSPQLAVLDVMMPKLSGVEVLARIRARPEASQVPIILISAAFPEDCTGADLPLGADDWIRKPFGSHELTDRVHAVLAR